MRLFLFLSMLLSITLQSCVGDDYVQDEVDPVIRITNNLASLSVDTTYQFEYMYLNNVGKETPIEVVWESSDPSIITIDNNGLATSIAKGTTEISVHYINDEVDVFDSKIIEVTDKTVVVNSGRSGQIKTTSSYKLSGDFTLEQVGQDLKLSIADNYTASTSLPGLFVYLTNNKNTTANALEIGRVTVFDGAHVYEIKNVDINQYSHVLYFCKPFNVKVGDGEIK